MCLASCYAGDAGQARAAGAPQGAALLVPPLQQAVRTKGPPGRPHQRRPLEREALW